MSVDGAGVVDLPTASTAVRLISRPAQHHAARQPALRVEAEVGGAPAVGTGGAPAGSGPAHEHTEDADDHQNDDSRRDDGGNPPRRQQQI